MSGFFSRRRRPDIERALRSGRPQPRAEFLEALTERVRGEQPVRARRGARVGLAGALTVLMIVPFAAFGGSSYASSMLTSAAGVATLVERVTHAHPTPPATHVTQVATQHVTTQQQTGAHHVTRGHHPPPPHHPTHPTPAHHQYHPGQPCDPHPHRGHPHHPPCPPSHHPHRPRHG